MIERSAGRPARLARDSTLARWTARTPRNLLACVLRPAERRRRRVRREDRLLEDARQRRLLVVREASRVGLVQTSSHLHLVDYDYLGAGEVEGIEYGEPDVFQRRHGASAGTYPDLDRFGRVLSSRWTKDLSTDMDFVSVDVAYDEDSNPLTTEDNIYSAGFDVKYAVDGLDRVTDADEGTLSSGSITSRTRRQQWTLNQTGNWDNERLDLNGDGAWAATNEQNDTRTHNAVNELTARDTDTNGTDNYTLTYDAAGNLTSDGESYDYVYDAWYRLRQVKKAGTGNVVSEHQYYGNGFRAGEHYDSDASGTVDSSDKWFWFGYDERWRIVGTYRDTDSSPKERFLHHSAGAGGYGGSSYIDQVILRERDANTSWNGTAGDGTLEERLYYCQNWRHDVVALVTSGGALKERARYFSYGIPFGIPLGDTDADGDVDAADSTIMTAAVGTCVPKCDLDLSGSVDSADQAIQAGQSGATAGYANLTLVKNRVGYSGHMVDQGAPDTWKVRHRALIPILGRWAQRDPLPYVDGSSLAAYARNMAIATSDSYGLSTHLTFSPVPGSHLGFCGNYGCGAFYRLWDDYPTAPGVYALVAKLTFSIDAGCCDSQGGHGGDTKYEHWGFVTKIGGRWIPSGGPHALGDEARCYKWFSEAKSVDEVKLLPPVGAVATFVSQGALFVPLDDPCYGLRQYEMNNPTWDDPPAGWATADAINDNNHIASVFFTNCCAQMGPPARSGTCIPGAFDWSTDRFTRSCPTCTQ